MTISHRRGCEKITVPETKLYLTYIYWSSISPTHNAWFEHTGFRKWGYHIKWDLVTYPNRTKQFEFGLGFEFRSTRLLQSLKALVIKLVQEHVSIFSLHTDRQTWKVSSNSADFQNTIYVVLIMLPLATYTRWEVFHCQRHSGTFNRDIRGNHCCINCLIGVRMILAHMIPYNSSLLWRKHNKSKKQDGSEMVLCYFLIIKAKCSLMHDKVKPWHTFGMSHFLHGCWGNHDWHRNFESQNSSGHVDVAYINKNTWSKPILDDKMLVLEKTTLESSSAYQVLLLLLLLSISNSLNKIWSLTEFLQKHFCFQPESTGPLLLMHNSQTPSLAISALQLPHTHWRWLSPPF